MDFFQKSEATCPDCGIAKDIHAYFFTQECLFIAECPRCGATDTRKVPDPAAVRQMLEHGPHPVRIHDLATRFRHLIHAIFTSKEH